MIKTEMCFVHIVLQVGTMKGNKLYEYNLHSFFSQTKLDFSHNVSDVVKCSKKKRKKKEKKH